MANINFLRSAANSRAPGLKNQKPNVTGSVAIPAQNIAVGSYVKYSFTMALSRTNALTTFRVNIGGLETLWRQVQGYIQVDVPNTATRTYSIQVQIYYSGTNLVCDTYVINQSGGVVAIPALTISGEVNRFVAPF